MKFFATVALACGLLALARAAEIDQRTGYVAATASGREQIGNAIPAAALREAATNAAESGAYEGEVFLLRAAAAEASAPSAVVPSAAAALAEAAQAAEAAGAKSNEVAILTAAALGATVPIHPAFAAEVAAENGATAEHVAAIRGLAGETEEGTSAAPTLPALALAALQGAEAIARRNNVPQATVAAVRAAAAETAAVGAAAAKLAALKTVASSGLIEEEEATSTFAKIVEAAAVQLAEAIVGPARVSAAAGPVNAPPASTALVRAVAEAIAKAPLGEPASPETVAALAKVLLGGPY